jgi:hypothetical protein
MKSSKKPVQDQDDATESAAINILAGLFAAGLIVFRVMFLIIAVVIGVIFHA